MAHRSQGWRNDPCPCGSGEKYKRYCGGAMVTESAAPDIPITDQKRVGRTVNWD